MDDIDRALHEQSSSHSESAVLGPHDELCGNRDLKQDTVSRLDTSDTSDTSDSSDSSDSSDTSESESERGEDEDLDDVEGVLDADDDGDDDGEIPHSKNELLEFEIPVVPADFKITEATPLELIGTVKSVVDKTVVVESIHSGRYRVLDEGAIFVVEKNDGKSVLGLLFETFGPIDHPFYVVRFNSEEEIAEFRPLIGANVHEVVSTAHYVLTEELKSKGTDASNFNDEEVPLEEQEFSDDEEEMMFKKSKQKKKSKPKQQQQHPQQQQRRPNAIVKIDPSKPRPRKSTWELPEDAKRYSSRHQRLSASDVTNEQAAVFQHLQMQQFQQFQMQMQFQQQMQNQYFFGNMNANYGDANVNGMYNNSNTNNNNANTENEENTGNGANRKPYEGPPY